jgi:protein SCO1/2
MRRLGRPATGTGTGTHAGTRAWARPVAVTLALALMGAAACAQESALASAQGDALAPAPAGPAVSLTQHLATRLPLAARFTDSDGRPIRLSDEFAGDASPGLRLPGATRPVILALGYYRCPQLCGLLMHGILESAHATGLPASAYRIVFASIDPEDRPADAAARRRVDLAYARFLEGTDAAPLPAIDLLVGTPANIEALAAAVGDVYQPAPGSGSFPAATANAADAPAARFAHPAGIVVVTPDGRISRYLMGVRFDADELRSALVEASGGHIGTLTDRLALLCAHIDPRVGAWTPTVIEGMRVVGIATVLLLALLVARQRAVARRRAGDGTT